MLISFLNRTWTGSAKTTSNWLVTTILLCQPSNLTWIPIENLSGFVKTKMRNTYPNNTDELMAAMKAIWSSITLQHCYRPMASALCRIHRVIHAKGAMTIYGAHKQTYFSEVLHLCIVNPFWNALRKFCNMLEFWSLVSLEMCIILEIYKKAWNI